MPSSIQALKMLHDAVVGNLLGTEPSLAVESSTTLSKALLLAGASELEFDIQRIVTDYFNEVTHGNADATQFVVKKALTRQYHTLFEWSGSNVNSFFALFGADFKAYAVARVKADPELGEQIKAFLRLGQHRNELVHGNFVAFSLSLSIDEIVELYGEATLFRDALPGILRRK